MSLHTTITTGYKSGFLNSNHEGDDFEVLADIFDSMLGDLVYLNVMSRPNDLRTQILHIDMNFSFENCSTPIMKLYEDSVGISSFGGGESRKEKEIITVALVTQFLIRCAKIGVHLDIKTS